MMPMATVATVDRAQLAVAFAQHSEAHAARLMSLGLPGHLRAAAFSRPAPARGWRLPAPCPGEQPSRITLLQADVAKSRASIGTHTSESRPAGPVNGSG